MSKKKKYNAFIVGSKNGAWGIIDPETGYSMFRCIWHDKESAIRCAEKYNYVYKCISENESLRIHQEYLHKKELDKREDEKKCNNSIIRYFRRAFRFMVSK